VDPGGRRYWATAGRGYAAPSLSDRHGRQSRR